MTTITKGFMGEISWVTESAYGDGVSTASVLSLIANQVQAVKLGRNTPLGETRNIGSYDVSAFIRGVKMYGLTTEYYQDRNYTTADILYKEIKRVTNELASVAFQVAVGKDQTTATWFNLKGCRAKTITVSTEEDGPFKVSIDWSVKDVATSTAKTVSCTDSITTAPKSFVGGSFKRGASATWGYVVGSATVTIDNGLQEVKDIGNTTLIDAVPGARKITGSVNVCLTDGGAAYWAEVTNGSSDAIELDFGATSNDPSIRFTSAIIGSLEIPLDSDSAIVMTTVPFTGTQVEFEAA